MNPQKVFFDRVTGMASSLTHAVVRSVYFRIDDEWRLASARLTFSTQPSGSERHDHRDVLFLSRTLNRDEALAGLRQLVASKSTTGLQLEHCPPFNQSPDVLSRPESMPVPFGQGKRLTGWPEYRFRFRGEYSMNSPSLPIVRPGIPIIADAWEAVEAWMHEPRPHNSDVAFDVVVPQAGARLRHAAIGPDLVTVHAEGIEGSGVRMHFSGQGEVDVQRQADTYTAPLDADLPETVTIFLVNMHDEVLDWAHIRTREARHEAGIQVTWPTATYQDAIARGEGEATEFKSDWTKQNREDVLASISAFANGKGGTIYFGVADDGTIKGVPNVKRTMDLIHEWSNTLLDPRPDWKAHTLQLEGVDVVVMEVLEGNQRPYQVKATGKCHVRRGASDFTMTRSELLSSRGHPSFPTTRRRL